MNIILSIKPKYVKKIKNGEKRYEFRKSVPKRNVNQILIYSSSPVQKIIGIFDFNGFLKMEPHQLWKKCQKEAGINEDEFFEYFEGKEIGYGLKINNLNLFNREIDPTEIESNFIAPQSFKYTSIRHSDLKNLVSHQIS